MSRQLEQALLSLMPTHGSDLPPRLVDLASSLLAQSRHKASTLKAEEEIARHYACANIACDRLKISLDLPPIEPRPPIPPRAYQRLYSYLSNLLPNANATPRSSRIRTPSAKKLQQDGRSEDRPLPSRATPTKEASLAQFRSATGSSKRTPTARRTTIRAAAHGTQEAKDCLYPWIRPVVKFMCAESKNQNLAPSLLAGMEHTLLPQGRPTQDTWAGEHVTDLVAAFYFFVLMRARSATLGVEIDREGYVPFRKEILALLSRARVEVALANADEGDGTAAAAAAWDGWGDIKARDFDAAIAKVNDSDWLMGDWYDGIVDVVNSTEAKAAAATTALAGVDGEDAASALPSRRADAMLQSRYEYLRQDMKDDYIRWRETMLARIAGAQPADTSVTGDT